MKINYVILLMLFWAVSCNEQPKDNTKALPADKSQQNFFPVTDFLNGQISEIKTKGINPLKIVHAKGRYDSSWISITQMQEEFSAFLSPLIDSANMASMFIEKAFLDQTLGAFTFTYDPAGPLPDSFMLQRWDVYVDPEKNTVKRIYLLKKTPDNKTLQLTWQADKWCKTVTISADSAAAPVLEKEVTIKWDF